MIRTERRQNDTAASAADMGHLRHGAGRGYSREASI